MDNEEIMHKHPETKLNISKPSNHVISKNLKAKQNKSERRKFGLNLQTNKNNSSAKVDNMSIQGLKSENTTSTSEQLEESSTVDQKDYLSEYKENKSKNTTLSECIDSQHPGMIMENKCMYMYPETKKEENATSLKSVRYQTKPSPLVLGSCSYIDLT